MSSPIPALLTPRLVLLPVTLDSILAEKICSGAYCSFGEHIGCIVPPEWPPIHWEPHVLDFFVTHLAEDPEQSAWNRYVALPQPVGNPVLIGTIGANMLPSSPEICEIGYGILPPFEGKGYATEGMRAVLNYLRNHSRVAGVAAHTFPSHLASIRVMEKCGLVYDGPGVEPGTIRYRLDFH